MKTILDILNNYPALVQSISSPAGKIFISIKSCDRPYHKDCCDRCDSPCTCESIPLSNVGDGKELLDLKCDIDRFIDEEMPEPIKTLFDIEYRQKKDWRFIKKFLRNLLVGCTKIQILLAYLWKTKLHKKFSRTLSKNFLKLGV